MQVFLTRSLTIAIALTLGTALGDSLSQRLGLANAPQTNNTEFEQSELIQAAYTYRRYNGGAGRREILS